MIEDTSCPLCSRNAEDGGHLFIRCKEVKMVWRAMGMEAMRRDLERYNVVGDVMDHLWTLKMEDRVQIMYFWWEWWNERNRVRTKEKRMRPEELVHRVKLATMEYWEVVGKHKKQSPKDRTRWRAPDDRIIKLNIDRAHMPENAQSAWGVIARDHTGDVVA